MCIYLTFSLYKVQYTEDEVINKTKYKVHRSSHQNRI
jgi:hypothetical protein